MVADRRSRPRDGPRARDDARAGRARNPLPAGRGISRRASARSGSTADFNEDSRARAHARTGRTVDTPNCGHHRRECETSRSSTCATCAPHDRLSTSRSACCTRKWRDPGEEPKLHLFGQLKRIARQWLEEATSSARAARIPAQLMYQELADMACERITAAITRVTLGERPGQGDARSLQPDRLDGPRQLQHDQGECAGRPIPADRHVNWVICDSDWEAEFCRVVESHPRVRAYVKNHNLGLRGALPVRLESAHVPPRLHRPGRRRPRRTTC